MVNKQIGPTKTRGNLMKAAQSRLKNSEKARGTEPMADLSIPSNDGNAKRNFLDMTALIRSIQRAEGNPDCFQKGRDDCDQVDCAWRPYCLGRRGKFEKGNP
jgi:hypothetical protein